MSSKTKSTTKAAKSESEQTKKRKNESSIADQNQNQKIAKKNAVALVSNIPTITSDIRLPDDVLKRIEIEPGKVVIAGNVAWDTVGKSGTHYELTVFHRLDDKMYRGVASSCSAAHSLLIDAEYKAYSFGRNEFGQLGHSKRETYEKPTKIKALVNVNIIQAACGKNHSLFLTDTGVVYACGDMRNGQLGIGKRHDPKKPVTEPTRIQYDGAPIVKVGCGGNFSVILDINGKLHSFGHPEYGQLGHNTDGQFFITNTKLAFHEELTPRRITSYIEKTKQGHSIPITDVRIVEFACGKNHTIAIDSEKRAFSFGFGGYGRLGGFFSSNISNLSFPWTRLLGHNDVVDEWIPRLIKYLNVTVTGGAVRAYCGSTFSVVISGHNNPYFFGKNNGRQTGQSYPKVVNDLCGFDIKSVGCSNTSIVLAADNNVVAWGSSPTCGELGIGDMPKSSSSPTFVENLKGAKVSQIAMGLEHTLMILTTDDSVTNGKYSELPEFNMD